MNNGTREPILLSYRPDKLRRGVQNARSRLRYSSSAAMRYGSFRRPIAATVTRNTSAPTE